MRCSSLGLVYQTRKDHGFDYRYGKCRKRMFRYLPWSTVFGIGLRAVCCILLKTSMISLLLDYTMWVFSDIYKLEFPLNCYIGETGIAFLARLCVFVYVCWRARVVWYTRVFVISMRYISPLSVMGFTRK